MPRERVLRSDGEEVEVSIGKVSSREEIVEVVAPDGIWRFSVSRTGRPTLLTTQNAQGELADLEIPEWMDDVLGRFDVQGVEA